MTLFTTMSAIKTEPFRFKQFTIEQDRCVMKIGTDGVLLGAWADVSGTNSILDIGSGTGVVAVMLAQRSDASLIQGVEIDRKTFEQAKENMQQCPWQDRLTAIHTSIQDYVQTTNLQYDLIVSNPPFFSGGTFSKSHDKNSVRHTVKLSHGDLLISVRTLLEKQGKFCLILPLIEGLRFQELARSYHLHCTKMTEVIPKSGKRVERLLLQFEKMPKPMEKSRLLMRTREGENNWTEEYKALTGGFYLKM